MKPFVPYNILLVLALAACGLIALYNLVFRETFSVVVGYQYPQPAVLQEEPAVQPVAAPPVYDDGEGEGEEWDQPQQEAVSFPLELNSATWGQLLLIPGVGDVTAQRILQYREALGGYDRLEQLMEIKGIGEKSFEKIAPYLYLRAGQEEDAQPEEAGDA